MKHLRSIALLATLATLATLAQPSAVRAQGGQVILKAGMGYDPDPLRTVAVVPVKGGPYADSLTAIVERDLDRSDRVSILRLNASDNALFYDKFKGVSYDFFTGLNASYVVEMTATQGKLTMNVHEVGKRRLMNSAEFALPAAGLGRDWRMAVHIASDSAVAILTEGSRGIAATRIAYTRGQLLRVIDSDGAFDTNVPADSNALSPSWDPTGTRLVYATYGTDSRVIITNLLTGQAHTVQKPISSSGMQTPIFTPDGNSVVYARSGGDGYNYLYRVSLAGGDPLQLNKNRGSITNPTMSPDGRRIAFMTDRLGHNEVYIIDADGSNPVLITNIAGDFNESAYRAEPDWSPDGTAVALQTRVSGNFQIMIVNLRDNQATILTNVGENQSPSWAPDGRHIVFTSNRTGSDQLWILDTRSSVPRQLTNQSGVRYGAWSPRLTVRP